MSDNQVSTLAFRLLADLTAAGSAARFAVRAISAAHFPAPHTLFEESSALCDETTEGEIVTREESHSGCRRCSSASRYHLKLNVICRGVAGC